MRKPLAIGEEIAYTCPIKIYSKDKTMIPQDSKKTKVLMTASISREVETRLNDVAQQTGNKSHIVEKALRQYFGMGLKPEQELKSA
jgi:hypothetical protein